MLPLSPEKRADENVGCGMVGIPWWIGLLFLAALLVLPDLFAAFLSTFWMRFPGLDKPTHFAAFVVVFLIAYGVLRSPEWPVTERGRLGAALGLSLMISLADEVQQAVVGHGRTAEYGDLVADAAGALVGMTAVSAGRLGLRRAIAIAALLLLPVAAVTAHTYNDLRHFNRGVVFEREHDYQRARTEYMLALKSGVQSAVLYNAIAWLDIEFLDADPAEAERYAVQALAMDPSNPDILDTYGWILVREGRAREGLAFLERAKALNPAIYCIDLHIGIAYRKLGDTQRAVQYLKLQVKRSPVDRFGKSARTMLSDMGTQAE